MINNFFANIIEQKENGTLRQCLIQGKHNIDVVNAILNLVVIRYGETKNSKPPNIFVTYFNGEVEDPYYSNPLSTPVAFCCFDIVYN